VADGSVTIGVAGLLEDDPKLATRQVALDYYGLLCSAGHPLAGRRSISWNMLRGEKMIGSDAFEVLMGAGLVPRLPSPDLNITSRAPLLACVRRNLGVAILPMLTRPGPGEGFSFMPLTRPRVSRMVAIITRTESLLPAGRRLADMLGASLRTFAVGRGAKLVEPRGAEGG
jgi:DNA-binding transcriptional LysR family regulator